ISEPTACTATRTLPPSTKPWKRRTRSAPKPKLTSPKAKSKSATRPLLTRTVLHGRAVSKSESETPLISPKVPPTANPPTVPIPKTKSDVPVAESQNGSDALFSRSGLTSKRSEEHTSELQSRENLVCRLLLEKKNAR